jgi:hypothetical protein
MTRTLLTGIGAAMMPNLISAPVAVLQCEKVS